MLERQQKAATEDKENYKKLAPPVAKALNSLKQKIKKFISAQPKAFEDFQKGLLGTIPAIQKESLPTSDSDVRGVHGAPQTIIEK